MEKRSSETICRAELSDMRNTSLQSFIVKAFSKEWGLEVKNRNPCAFSIWYSFPLLRSNVTHEVICVLKYAMLGSCQQLRSHFTQWPHSAKAYLVTCSTNYVQQCLWFCTSLWGPILMFVYYTRSWMSRGRKEETVVQDGFKTGDGSDEACGDI